MNLYLISQRTNTGYDTFSDAVVCAKSPKDAAVIHPADYKEGLNSELYDSWVPTPDLVAVEFLGEAKKGTKRGVVCASFHAG